MVYIITSDKFSLFNVFAPVHCTYSMAVMAEHHHAGGRGGRGLICRMVSMVGTCIAAGSGSNFF